MAGAQNNIMKNKKNKRKNSPYCCILFLFYVIMLYIFSFMKQKSNIRRGMKKKLFIVEISVCYGVIQIL